MPAPTRRILVTSALPYANGSIHIGHLVEYIQTDIFVRFQRLLGNDVTYVCGDDSHGTAIMVSARKAGVSSETLIAEMKEQHKKDFATFGVVFDHYDNTHSQLNRELSYTIYQRVKDADYIARANVEQFYDPVEQTFLADRFLRGTCPHCKTPDQYGGECENCGRSNSGTNLIDPRSVFSGTVPELRQTEHIFLKLEPARDFLLKLYETSFADEPVTNKLKEWFTKEVEQPGKTPGDPPVKVRVPAELKDWDISRDAKFFGFEIPGETGKYFYNWFDAPIGYIASFGARLKENAKGVEAAWNDPDLEIYHFIGKDIQYFHGLFWPTMLHVAGFKLPTKLAIHGHLKVNGERMSKSRGTFINASVYAKHLDPNYLRYFFASKLGPLPEDLDFNVEDFKAKIDGELVNKLANLVSRCAPMLSQKLDGNLGLSANDAVPLLEEIRLASDDIAKGYESRNFAAVTRLICALADKANKYVEDQAPWKLLKTTGGDPESARGVLTAALEAGRILTIYLKPILPDFAAKVEKCLAIPPLTWSNIQDAIDPHKIATFEHLVQRLDPKKVEAMIEESKDSLAPKTPTAAVAAPAPAAAPTTPQSPLPTTPVPPAPADHPDVEPLAPTINIDQFAAVDLRVGLIIAAQAIEKSDKLLKLTINAGPLGNRTILAGIKKAYAPESLVNRLVIFCANLAPRAMGKGGSLGTSEGMICAASPHNGPPNEIFVLSPDSGAKPGQRIH